MTWFAVHDGFHASRKAARAGLEALGLWTMAGSWCAEKRTDGFISRAKALDLCDDDEPALERATSALVRAKLWISADRDGEVGWQFHDWADYNPTHAELAERDATRHVDKVKAGRKGGLATASRRQQTVAECSNAQQPRADTEQTAADPKQNTANVAPVPSRPVPSRPVPSPERERRARAAPVPEARPDPGPITRGPTCADFEPEVRILLELRRHEVLVTGAASGCDLPELASALIAPLLTRAPSSDGISRWLPAIAVAIADAAAELGSRAAAGAPVSPEEAASLLRRYVGSTLRKPVPPPLPEPDTPALPPGIVPAGTIDRNAKPPPPRTARPA